HGHPRIRERPQGLAASSGSARTSGPSTHEGAQMRYRAVVTLASGAALIAALAGCTNDTGGPGGTDGGGSGGSTDALTWATVTSDRAGAEAIIEKFEADTGIDVTLVVADVDEYQTTL